MDLDENLNDNVEDIDVVKDFLTYKGEQKLIITKITSRSESERIFCTYNIQDSNGYYLASEIKTFKRSKHEYSLADFRCFKDFFVISYNIKDKSANMELHLVEFRDYDGTLIKKITNSKVDNYFFVHTNENALIHMLNEDTLMA